jgi:hypothetical protein
MTPDSSPTDEATRLTEPACIGREDPRPDALQLHQVADQALRAQTLFEWLWLGFLDGGDLQD